jgi:hypothetical protein
MDKTETAIIRGQRAKNILDDDLVKEANEHIEAELWRLFKETSPSDKDTLEHIKAMQYFHVKYWAYLNRVLADGKIAQINLEAKKKSIKERIFG